MALTAPNLDDRRFQDLVDDAKRYVQQFCPEWTDHNVSDPGVTLIELFAQMTDQVIYRMNRVPQRHYIKFLELIGLRRFPPTPARVGITFWLSTTRTELVTVPGGSVCSTRRTETEEAVNFTTLDDLRLIPATLLTVRSSIVADRTRDHNEDIAKETGFLCFDAPPKSGDHLLIGLTEAVPKCAIRLQMRCTIEGIGVDPENPPLRWEAWTGAGWEACELTSDSTGGLNRTGEVVIHVPRGHETSVIARQRAGWIRARIIDAVENQPVYSASPQIYAVDAATIGGTEEAINASLVREEYLGPSDASAGQRMSLQHQNVVTTRDAVLSVSDGTGWENWQPVTSFADSGPDDRHYMIDGVDGEVIFGPMVRLEDGSIRQFGKVPPKDAIVRLENFAYGGGALGNVNKGSVAVSVTPHPYITRVENRRGALGGRDSEPLENALLRGPLILRSRNRAVTAEDFETIAAEAAPEVARVRCVRAGDDPADAGGVRVLVVPDLPDDFGRIRFEQLLPAEESLKRIADALDARRLIGVRATVEPPYYQGVTVVARVRCSPDAAPQRIQDLALTALYRYYNPLRGGPDGAGWPFGRPLLVGEVYSVLQRIKGVELIDDVRLFSADPVSGQRGESAQRIDIDRNALAFSFEHQVLVAVA